jgi:hypothetical protein
MVLIFSASADEQSVARTSRFLEPFLRWLKPDISTEANDFVRLIVRKCAHVSEFAVLAWLWWCALGGRIRSAAWSWKRAGLPFALSVLLRHHRRIPSALRPGSRRLGGGGRH